ncbi:stimulus-sensing domain-containing protein [Fodinicurvata sp. CAU 1616]|uniref:histidine kinase n=1 Tax=Aquibaculum arenosum TaxID=3032591 RepID=A0ABT5YLU4_9PROT|nr:stimulus-sensing domain-containing protein [Fodinicurvata sp. CAU 1616]
MTSRRSRPSTVSATATETAEPKAAAASGAKRRRSGRPEERTGETIAPRRSQLRGRQESSAEARRRLPAWRSPLTRRILLINTLVLLIPVLGLLHLEQYRQSLIDSEIEAMRTQATTVALALGSAAIRDGPQGDQQLMHESARQLIRVLLSDISLSAPLRARLFSQSGELVADSFMLGGPEAVVRVEELPPPQSRGLEVIRWIEDFYDKNMRRLLYPDALPLYQEQPRQSAAHYNEVEQALAGEGSAEVRQDAGQRLVLSVTVPVQRYRQVVAALMVSKDGGAIDRAVRDRRSDILLVFAVALAVTILLSLYLARTIARPIRRLAEAADRVRGSSGQFDSIPDMTARRDEIGDLSAALIEMTQALHSRLKAIEHFAADVAHEIKNPLTSLRSAVETVSRIENPEQRARLMAIIIDDVSRLDRLISDISDASRLDAELARAESERFDMAILLETLVAVERERSEDGTADLSLTLPLRANLTVMGKEGRLGQVFRNLIANALSFSPPDSTIRLAARREGAWVVITVDDEGPGIPEGKENAIFSRFYSERPAGEKFGTHSGLGLSISRQIVEAHHGTIVAENRPQGGARFTVRLPAAG